MFDNFYAGKTVLVTGNTGFKGSWLSVWLNMLGAKVVGLSDEIPTRPSMYEVANLNEIVDQYYIDIADSCAAISAIERVKPDIIFHLAAKAIVSFSYNNPLDTISTNILGTGVICEYLRLTENQTVAVFITSDKCYENVEWVYGYRENDRLGGKDIYSASKASAELIINAYYHSFFKAKSNIRVATARAGNVLGGGDWSDDRVVVDAIKKWSQGNAVNLRSPDATRPWQHVLEPLSGYLLLGSKLKSDLDIVGESFNFGPSSNADRTVKELIEQLYFKLENIYTVDQYLTLGNQTKFHEAKLLKLCCDKALSSLNWTASLNFSETIEFIADWYINYEEGNLSNREFTEHQIKHFTSKVKF